MFHASSSVRYVFVVLVCALAMPCARVMAAHSADLLLNVFYSDSHSISSGGSWELWAKSDPADFGLAGLTANIRNINSAVVNEAPRGIVNVTNDAGFGPIGFDNTQIGDYRAVTLGQFPLSPLPGGSEQTLFFGVGTLVNGTPGTVGPPFTSLTSPQNIPWGTGSSLGLPGWDTGVKMASGSFATGVTPAFASGSGANVFTTSTGLGSQVQVPSASFTAVVRTNFSASADFNRNGTVDAADFALWRLQFGATVAAGSGADGNNDTHVDIADLNLWRSHFGLPSGAGSGSGLATSSVPEPSGALLLTLGGLLASAYRTRRAAVNN